jgi:zinc protease
MTSRAPHLRLLDRPIPGVPPTPRVPVPMRWELSNGLRVVAVPRGGLPQLSMRLILPAGSSTDPAEKPGTAALAGALITEGTARHTAEELNERLDWLGASVEAQVGHDFAEVDVVTLSDTIPVALEILAEVLLQPSFPERETERARAETLDSLLARLDEPANVADDMAAESVFGTDHPYGRLTSGTAAGVAALTREELAAFHAAHYRPDGGVLLVAGDFDPEVLAPMLESALHAWTGTAPTGVPFSDRERPVNAGERMTVKWPDASQGEIRFAGLGMRRASPDWVPAAVANYLLGGSTITGRLGANLREDKGWTYGVRSGFAAALNRGGWVIETAVGVEVVDAAVAEITAEIERFTAEPVPPEELRRAKQALILSLPRAFETPGRIIARLGTVEAYGLEQNYWERFPAMVEAVTAEDVLRIARTYFPLDGLVRVAVGTPPPAIGGR